MSSPRPLDLDAWNRREHFRFFRRYEHPWFNLCAEVDVAPLVARVRAEGGPSFSVTALHASLLAANEIEEFRYRIRGEGVVVYDVVHGGSTVLRADGTFGFAYFDFHPDLEAFAGPADAALRAARNTGPLDAADDRDDLMHYSVIPWVAFTSFSHARRHDADNAIPKIVFGRRHGEPGAERMPVSVEVHHALMDGIHVGRFFERFQHHIGEA
jgi:chloramphenicol O-acetyltransferase type A